MFLVIIEDITHETRLLILEECNNYKTQLLYSVSHELRTPLNGSINMLDEAENEGSIPEIVK